MHFGKFGCLEGSELRYIGVIWVVYHVFGILPIRLHNKTFVALANIRWSISTIWTSLDLVMVIGGALFVDFFNWIHGSSQLLSAINFEDVVQSFLNMHLEEIDPHIATYSLPTISISTIANMNPQLGMLTLILPTDIEGRLHQSNIGVRFKK